MADASTALVVIEPPPELSPPEITTNGHPANDVPVTDVPTPDVEETHPEAGDAPGSVVEPEVNNEATPPSQTSEAPEAKPEACDFTNGVEHGSKTNLEDIVNLLETIPAARLSTEEISEIPDEDEDYNPKF